VLLDSNSTKASLAGRPEVGATPKSCCFGVSPKREGLSPKREGPVGVQLLAGVMPKPVLTLGVSVVSVSKAELTLEVSPKGVVPVVKPKPDLFAPKREVVVPKGELVSLGSLPNSTCSTAPKKEQCSSI